MLNETFDTNWKKDIRSPRGMPLPFLATRSDQQNHPNNWSGEPKEWMEFAIRLTKGHQDPKWQLVAAPEYNKGNVDNIRRGDILIRDCDVSALKKDQHWHVMIAMDKPTDGRLKIADSTSAPHGSTDSRTAIAKSGGMGRGEIKVKGNKVAWSVNGPFDRKLWVVRLK